MQNLTLSPGAVTFADLRAIWNGASVSLSADGFAAVEKAASSVAGAGARSTIASRG